MNDERDPRVTGSDLVEVLFWPLANTQVYMMPTSRRWWQVGRPKHYVQPDLAIGVILGELRTNPRARELMRLWLDDQEAA